ncbi:hypothetical protein Tco_1117885, partial [Tanacetum coccineum]
NFVIVDYESDPRVPLILGRPFLRTARALIDVHGEEMILRDGDERLTLNMRNDTSSYSNNPYKESINMIDIFNVSKDEYLEDLFAINRLSGNPTFSSHTDLTSPEVINSESGNPTLISKPETKSSSSPTLISPEESELIWEEFKAYLARDSFPPGNDDMTPEDVIKEVKCLLTQSPLANYSPNNDLIDTIPEMFTDEHTLDYSSPPIYDDDDDDLFDLKSDNDEWRRILYDDPFDFKEDKIKESKLLIDELNELDPPRSSDLLPSPECD